MNTRHEDRIKAIEMRKNGLTYSEISKTLNVTKGQLSGWLMNISLSEDEKSKIQSKIIINREKGRLNSSSSNRNRRINREIEAYNDAKKIFDSNVHKPDFIIGIALYWAEGSKRTSNFQFINSDPDMIILMYSWIQRYLGTQRDKIGCRLFIHDVPGYENVMLFWSGLLLKSEDTFEKTIYKKTDFQYKKNQDYKGCLRLSVGGIYNLRLMKAWQKMLIKYYNDIMRSWLNG